MCASLDRGRSPIVMSTSTTSIQDRTSKLLYQLSGSLTSKSGDREFNAFINSDQNRDLWKGLSRGVLKSIFESVSYAYVGKDNLMLNRVVRNFTNICETHPSFKAEEDPNGLTPLIKVTSDIIQAHVIAGELGSDSD